MLRMQASVHVRYILMAELLIKSVAGGGPLREGVLRKGV